MKLTPITDLIFDFFGTLVTYRPGQLSGEAYPATYQLLQEYGLTISYTAFAETFTHTFQALEVHARITHIEYPLSAVMRAFLEAQGTADMPESGVTALVETYIEEWNRGTRPLPEIRPFLATLASRYRLSILSNTHHRPLVEQNLMAMGVRDLMAQVVTSDTVGVRKPAAQIFTTALNQLGITAAQALFIGDTYRDDYLGATGAGLHAILIDPTERHPELNAARINSLFALPSVLPA